MLTNTHGLLLGSRGRTAQEPFCLSSSKYSLRPNTMQFLIRALFQPCTATHAEAGFSLLLLIATQRCAECSLHCYQAARTTQSEIIKNWKTRSKRDKQTDKYPQSFKVQKASLNGASKAFLRLHKTQKPTCYILMGNVEEERNFVCSFYEFPH